MMHSVDPSPYKIDHLVYGTPNFEATLDLFKKAYGIEVVHGGRHPRQGTKNALFNLGQGSYLEILSKDDGNPLSKKNVWMGLDYLVKPKLTRWALKSINLKAEQKISNAYNSEMGELQTGSRKQSDGTTLEWQLLMPLSRPEVELFPFFIDWGISRHPTVDLPEVASLKTLNFFHSQPVLVQPHLEAFALNGSIWFSEQISIEAQIEGPRGIFKL